MPISKYKLNLEIKKYNTCIIHSPKKMNQTDARIVIDLKGALMQTSKKPFSKLTLKERVTNNEKRLDTLEMRMDKLEKRMDALDHKMDLVLSAINNLATKVDEGFKRIEARLERIENTPTMKRELNS